MRKLFNIGVQVILEPTSPLISLWGTTIASSSQEVQQKLHEQFKHRKVAGHSIQRLLYSIYETDEPAETEGLSWDSVQLRQDCPQRGKSRRQIARFSRAINTPTILYLTSQLLDPAKFQIPHSNYT